MDYNLCDYKTITAVMKKHGFSFSKALGQNFIIDSGVCPEMVRALGADLKTGVIEIGPGIGVLTKELCKSAGRVVAVELDKRLPEILGETLADYDNVEIVSGDAMKIDLNALIKEKFAGMQSVKICANLPYYITSPVIMALLEKQINVDEIVVMVQKEAAQRLCAPVGSREAGAVTAAVNYRAESEILFEVGRESFMPAPKVDSAVIRLKVRKEKEIAVKNEKQFFSVIKAAFSQRRKTAVNSISNGLGLKKEKVCAVFEALNIEQSIRSEKLTLENFKNIAEEIYGKE